LSPAERPYKGGPVDQGVPPGAWDVVRPPKQYFADEHIHMVLPHSEHVERCHHCHGNGRVQCRHCMGGGTERCFSCHGTGLVEHTEYRRDGQGHQHPHTHRDRCNTCGGTGWRQCSVCWGRGTVTCGHCDGTGSLVIFTRLKISWENIKTESVVKESFDPQLIASLPDNKLSGADGPVLLAEQGWLIGPSQGSQGRINPTVNTAIDKLLNAAHAPAPRVQHQERIIVRGLPVYELAYLDGHDLKHIWVIGTDRKVHAPDYPLSIIRILLLTGGILLVVGAIVFLIVWFAVIKH